MVNECEIPTAQFLTEKPDKALARPGVYSILCDANGRYYVGGSGNIYRRFYGHRGALRNRRHHNPFISRAYSKYGESSFLFKVLEFCEKEKVIEREDYWLNLIRPYEDGFNIRKDAAGRPAQPSDKMLLVNRAMANRKNLNKFRFISPDGTLHEGTNLTSFCRNNGLNQANMWSVLNGKVISCLGWKLPNGRTRASNAWSLQRNYCLISPDGIEHRGENISKFARENNLTGTSLCLVMNGGQSHHKGWRKAPCS